MMHAPHKFIAHTQNVDVNGRNSFLLRFEGAVSSVSLISRLETEPELTMAEDLFGENDNSLIFIEVKKIVPEEIFLMVFTLAK